MPIPPNAPEGVVLYGEDVVPAPIVGVVVPLPAVVAVLLFHEKGTNN